jgi:hypothetical protein
VRSYVRTGTKHTVPGVAGIYNRFAYAADMAAAWKLWSKHVATLAERRQSNFNSLLNNESFLMWLKDGAKRSL